MGVRKGFDISSKSFNLLFRRVTLVFLCLVMTFTIGMPEQVAAIWPFDRTIQPSALPAQVVDTKKDQAMTNTSAGADSTELKRKVDRRLDYEIESMRTPLTSTYVNKDGTKTLRYSPEQQNYKQGNKWHKIDNTIKAIEKPAPVKGIMDILMNTEPRAEAPSEFTGKAGRIATKMQPLAEGLRIEVEDKILTMKPVGARNTKPERKDDHTIIYKNAWPHVDLEYQLRGELVKEIIVVKSKQARTNFDFDIDGGKVIQHPTRAGELAIEGISSEFSFSSLTLDVNEKGVISEERVTQTPTAAGIKVTMDKDWMQAQPDDSFPMRIDPSYGSFVANWWMFKSDGYSCNASNCYANIGTLHDGVYWKHWRTYIGFPYDALAGKRVLDANLHGWYQPGANGIADGRNIWMGHANCICFNGQGMQVGHAVVGTDFDINFTERLKYLVDINHFGAVWSLWGEEGPYKSFKPYYEMHASVVYDTPTQMATAVEPANGQVTVSTEPALRVNPVTDPDGDAVQYYFRVSTSPDAETGAVINSGWISGPQWTIPDGILQDGTTYYWHTYTRGATETVPNWVRSFKVDLRTGRDSTQAYDTVGPIGIDLATGNATTDTATHSMNALGGNIGLSLNYNTTAKSKRGLAAEYWNVSSTHDFSHGVPTSPPALTRLEQNINFNWNFDSPAPGVVNNDWFFARWKGYFVAPTTGTYQFGSSNDDAIAINVNGQTFTGCYGTTPCYNGSSIALTAGQAVPITVTFEEANGLSYAKVFVKGAVAEQIINPDWLRTEVVASQAQYGLTGRYFTDDGSHNFPTDSNDPVRLMAVRPDTKLSFNWGDGGPAPGLQVDNFMAKWTGYVTVPTTGSYTFGKLSDDGVRVKVNNGLLGAQQTVLDSWNYTAGEVWGSQTNLTTGQQIPITVEYYEANYGANFTLKMKGPGLLAGGEEIPVKWLTPKASALPDAWQLGVDVDGNVGYERLRVAGQNVILEDSTRATHEYTWTGSGYKPPVNEDGQLTRNITDNTYTLVDTDGRIYIFDAEGKLKSLTSPTDDRNPASLKYEYSGDPSRLIKITDGVTNSRYGTLHYKGINEEGNCSVPGGFDAAPDGMLCAFKTTDGDTTKLYYKSGQLSRVEKPGTELTDYGYDSLGRMINVRDSLAADAITASVRADDATVLTEITYDTLSRANAIKAPAPTASANRVNHTFDYQPGDLLPLYRFYRQSINDYTVNISSTLPDYGMEWQHGYVLSKSQAGTHGLYSCAVGVDRFISSQSNCEGYTIIGLLGYVYDTQQPGTTAIYRCMINGEHFTTLNSNCDGFTSEGHRGYIVTSPASMGSTQMHIAGAAEPSGFSKRVEYDNLLRTTKETDVANLSSLTEWDSVKDLELSKTDATGLKSTTIYDDDDKPVENYGPAPAAWYGADRKPLPANVNQVPKTTTAYDEGLVGPAVSWHNAKGSSLVGSPKLLTQGFDLSEKHHMGRDFRVGDLGFTPDSGMDGYGFSATGKVRFPSSGTYTLRIWHDDGVRVSINDQTVIDDWAYRSEGIAQNFNYGTFVAEANKVYRFKFDYLHVGNPGGLELWWAGPGIADAGGGIGTSRPTFVTPGYNLTTSQTAYDNQLGNVTTKTTYNKPEYGLVDKTSLDPTGLNLETTSTYETPGATGSFLRQTSKTLPGGGTTNYQHYSATDTRDNPCTAETEAYHQGGRPKGKIEADPDGAGSQTSRTSETIYNASGEVVATRYNNDDWTCTTYDARGRVVQTILPSRGVRQGRTITNNYSTDNNPLITTTTDDSGTIRVENDLLGRTIKYTDSRGKLTTNTYDNFGKLTSRTSPLGTESYEYDNYDRMTVQKLDGVTFATITYDQFGRIASVQYPAGISLSSITRDQLGRESSDTFTLASGQTLTDQITRATSGDIVSGTENGVTKQYSYDNAGRLIGATLGSNTYSYEFGTPDSSCNGLPGNNANTSKNGNRTKLIANSQVTTYCYDMADRLIASSDARLTNAQYDDHGNTIRLGTDTQKTEFGYDAGDRNTLIKETIGGQEKQLYYERDAQSRITRREAKTNNVVTSDTYYSFTGSGDTPDALLDASGNVVQKYVTLPGDVIATIKPGSTSAGAVTYSLPNIHGDVFATVNADGALTSTFINGPFGEQIAGQTDPANTATGATWSYVGQNQKLTESAIALEPTQMGVRVYIGQLGRFLSVDPVEGGTDNNYVYANDPVNEFDLGGNALETVADVASVGYDAYQMYNKPSWGNAGMLTWSIAAVFVPFVPGSYAGKAGVAAFKSAKGAVPAMTKKVVTAAKKIPSVAVVTKTKIVRAITKERNISKNIRIAIFGNPGANHGNGTPNWAARLPHVHIKKTAQPKNPNARTSKDWHRPWQTVFRKWFK